MYYHFLQQCVHNCRRGPKDEMMIIVIISVIIITIIINYYYRITTSITLRTTMCYDATLKMEEILHCKLNKAAFKRSKNFFYENVQKSE